MIKHSAAGWEAKNSWIAMLMVSALAWTACGGGGGPGGVPIVSGPTRTPVEHLIVVMAENESFDNVFATYAPPAGQSIANLLSRGIVNADGISGPNFSIAAQAQGSDKITYQIAPTQTEPYPMLPQPGLRGALILSPGLVAPTLLPDPGIDLAAQGLLFIGSATYSTPTGLCTADPEKPIACLGEHFDTRYPPGLPDGPYQITGPATPYTSYFGDPPHRFYQNWQQLDCAVADATGSNPSGCKGDLFAWVDDTVGTGGVSGNPTPSPTYYGGVAMGYYNMAKGDFPYLQSLARSFAISDNYHQAIMGGTAPNHQAMVTGDMLFFSDGKGNPITPPAALVENPNPVPGTDNWYTNDGEALSGIGGIFTDCSDPTQPGVMAITAYLNALPYHPFKGGNCAPHTFYMLNNEGPGFNTLGGPGGCLTGRLDVGVPCLLPPSSVPTIADALSAAGISWKFYGEGFDSANAGLPKSLLYDPEGNPFQYATSIMTTRLRNNLSDLPPFYNDVSNGTLPAVSFVKPDALVDGHPGSSNPPLVEAFFNKLVKAVQANPTLWAHTAIILTFDESGGYYDSGYVQPIDFFGDGPRVPLIVVSPLTRPGFVDHTYNDHVSILKFIEYNWKLSPLSARSRDNLPDPSASAANPYLPANAPAIGDLTTLFNFTK